MMKLEMVLVERLQSAVTGITGLRIGRWADRSTWAAFPPSAAAQAILDAFDPKQALAEIEAEEKARAEKQAALEKLADWMQQNPAEAVKLMEATAKLATLETKVAAIEAKVTVKP